MIALSKIRPLNGFVRRALAVAGLVFAVGCGGSTPPPAPPPTVSAPVITTHPQSHTATADQYVSLSVVATGTGLTYKWQRNGVAISGLSSATFYTFKAALKDNGAHYAVEVSNAGGSVTSLDAVLTVAAAFNELIVNGSFEFLASDGNASSWTFSDTKMTIKYSDFSMTPPQGAGAYFLVNGYWGEVKSDQVSQKLTIPAGATQATLSFKNAVGNADFAATAGAPVNTWTVKIKDSAGADLATLLTQTDNDELLADKQPVWTSRSYDLLAYKGQTIQLAFGSAQTDKAKNTLFGTDLVSLNVK